MDFVSNYGFQLMIPEAIKDTMDQRFILVSDIEKVIDSSRRNNDRFINPETVSYLAKLRLENVTYWVEYKEIEDDLIQVERVYSHRMEVLEDLQ